MFVFIWYQHRQTSLHCMSRMWHASKYVEVWENLSDGAEAKFWKRGKKNKNHQGDLNADGDASITNMKKNQFRPCMDQVQNVIISSSGLYKIIQTFKYSFLIYCVKARLSEHHIPAPMTKSLWNPENHLEHNGPSNNVCMKKWKEAPEEKRSDLDHDRINSKISSAGYNLNSG